MYGLNGSRTDIELSDEIEHPKLQLAGSSLCTRYDTQSCLLGHRFECVDSTYFFLPMYQCQCVTVHIQSAHGGGKERSKYDDSDCYSTENARAWKKKTTKKGTQNKIDSKRIELYKKITAFRAAHQTKKQGALLQHTAFSHNTSGPCSSYQYPVHIAKSSECLLNTMIT